MVPVKKTLNFLLTLFLFLTARFLEICLLKKRPVQAASTGALNQDGPGLAGWHAKHAFQHNT